MKVNEKVIVYESFLGRNYSDSPKYIYQYSQKHYPGQFKHVWIAAKGSNVKKRFS
ncbi:CDP-glycerol glycerophosphotransferase family protein [Apilactobacillus ozensis]|uniref:CDP-glycerol glycerophosphotransferase family protein n=1 Tax=Apilactobacillus ozensis TaxID=866801 RepID=UPI000AB6908F|nr:CDP-glycerol glycerophosphotransferase family protein [Apilactobacillus ozensis]